MVAVQIGANRAVWNGRQWAGKHAGVVAILNARRDLVLDYLPNEVNARAMIKAAFGDGGWSVIRSDPQPTEPGVVY